VISRVATHIGYAMVPIEFAALGKDNQDLAALRSPLLQGSRGARIRLARRRADWSARRQRRENQLVRKLIVRSITAAS
jgi:hypothetical protein